MSKDNTNYKKRILNKCIRDEFKEKISSVFNIKTESDIELYFDEQNADYYLQIRNNNEIINLMSYRTIMDRLVCFYGSDNTLNNRVGIDNLFENFDGIMNVYTDKDKTFYIIEYFDEPINPIQISQGLKSILILKQLFLNYYVKKQIFYYIR